MQEEPLAGQAQELATRLHVVDALVFRRVSVSTWVHLGGLGRGRGWAGIVEIDECADQLAHHIPGRAGDVRVFSHQASGRVLGPYYARAGALVRVSNDVVVVVGNPTDPLDEAARESDLCELARLIDASVEEVAPSKRLADELEVLHAIRALTSEPPADLPATLRHILEVSLSALSCEFGILRDGTGHTVWADPTGFLAGNPTSVAQVLDELDARARGDVLCLQGADDYALPVTNRVQGILSVLAVPLPQPSGGMLVVAHTDVAARGFTGLCQQLAGQLADAASVIAHTAALRDELSTAAEEQRRVARTDALTGVRNRLAWEEALEQAQHRVDDGCHLSIILVDVDGLKTINDNYGHNAGDDALRACASILCDHARDGDVIARLGGDEFGILLPVGEDRARERVDALRGALGTPGGPHTVTASVGVCIAAPGDRISDTVRAADTAMYLQKNARRATRPAARRFPSTPAHVSSRPGDGERVDLPVLSCGCTASSAGSEPDPAL